MKKIIIVNFIVMCMTVIFAARPVLAERKTAGGIILIKAVRCLPAGSK